MTYDLRCIFYRNQWTKTYYKYIYIFIFYTLSVRFKAEIIDSGQSVCFINDSRTL